MEPLLVCEIFFVDLAAFAMLEKLLREDLLSERLEYALVALVKVEHVRKVRVKQPKFTIL